MYLKSDQGMVVLLEKEAGNLGSKGQYSIVYIITRTRVIPQVIDAT
jgi:hypothetical protein